MVIASPRSTFETVRLFFRLPNLAKGRKTNAKRGHGADRLQAEVYRKRLLREKEPDSDKVSSEQSGASNSRCLRATCSRRAKDLTAMFVGMASTSTAIAKALRDENMPTDSWLLIPTS
ncbi:unnamed protein product [Caenorhabditis auriculariae]|uniref:Uncharacterized protein n=1 Tax=Caenorhabditis auriculariae TaxID=2777116 RepID=A0A8S1HYA2_9PELO|nr:unnamed protein product [Caenorhabditis auriculariae]